jgi:hypothetical protein
MALGKAGAYSSSALDPATDSALDPATGSALVATGAGAGSSAWRDTTLVRPQDVRADAGAVGSSSGSERSSTLAATSQGMGVAAAALQLEDVNAVLVTLAKDSMWL